MLKAKKVILDEFFQDEMEVLNDAGDICGLLKSMGILITNGAGYTNGDTTGDVTYSF